MKKPILFEKFSTFDLVLRIWNGASLLLLTFFAILALNRHFNVWPFTNGALLLFTFILSLPIGAWVLLRFLNRDHYLLFMPACILGYCFKGLHWFWLVPLVTLFIYAGGPL